MSGTWPVDARGGACDGRAGSDGTPGRPDAAGASERRPWRPWPAVTVHPGVNFGDPSVRGIRCDALAEQVWAGESAARVAADYDLSRAEVLVACWFLGTYGIDGHGTRRDGTRLRFGGVWRARWGAWAAQVEPALWRGEDDVPDPPSGTTKEDER